MLSAENKECWSKRGTYKLLIHWNYLRMHGKQQSCHMPTLHCLLTSPQMSIKKFNKVENSINSKTFRTVDDKKEINLSKMRSRLRQKWNWRRICWLEWVLHMENLNYRKRLSWYVMKRETKKCMLQHQLFFLHSISFWLHLFV
jgi:hypothetical protein